jgi:hypothetical protein
MFGRRLTDAEVDAFSKLPEPEDKMGPVAGMCDVMRELAGEVKKWRALISPKELEQWRAVISPKDIELLQVVRGVLSVDIEDSEGQRDAMKDVFPQFSDMCQGSVEDYKNADALLVRLITIAGGT